MIYLKRNKGENFYRFAERFIEESKETKAPLTIRSYTQTILRMKEYCSNLRFKDIDQSFCDGFIDYHSENGISPNTIGKYIKVLKTMLNEAKRQGILTNPAFLQSIFNVQKKETESVVLNKDEISLLESYCKGLSDREKRIIENFLIGCYTGLKFPEIPGISGANIHIDKDKNHMLQIRRDARVLEYAVSPNLLVILNEYGGKPPTTISIQKINKTVKKICHEAGIGTKGYSITKEKGFTGRHVRQKYEKITFDTSRRSFATNAYLNGMSLVNLMQILGYKSEIGLMMYIKGNQLDKPSDSSSHPFL